MPSLHPDVAPFEFLLGSWAGEGRGVYPTIAGFTYREEVSFDHVGKPFLTYAQKTWRTGDHPEAGTPLHSETGYLRPAGPGRAELVIAQPTGIVEVDEGEIDGPALVLHSKVVGLTSTAREVTSVERRLRVARDTLSYELWMAALGQPHQLHLEAELFRRNSADGV